MGTNKPVHMQVKGNRSTPVIALVEILASGKYRVTILVRLLHSKAYRIYDEHDFWDSTERSAWISSFGANIPTLSFSRYVPHKGGAQDEETNNAS